jgi:hypothetical protein
MGSRQLGPGKPCSAVDIYVTGHGLVKKEAKRRQSDGVAGLGAEFPTRLGAREPE